MNKQKTLAPNATFSLQNEVVIIFLGSNGHNRAVSLNYHLPTTTLYLPDKTSPMSYQWPLRGCYVHLCDTGRSTVRFIKFCAETFFSYGAINVQYISQFDYFNFEKGVSK